MADRLLVDLGGNGEAGVLWAPGDGGLPEEVSRGPMDWPLDGGTLEELRWYLEDYLLAPFGVWESRGPAVRERLAGWGEQVFGSVFGGGKARDVYQRARDRGLDLVFRSSDPALLGRPWELMRDDAGPVALGTGGIARSLPVAGGAGTLDVPGGKLRVLMVISRPAGGEDVGYQMVARPLLRCLDAVRGEVELTVLRPPTLDRLSEVVRKAAEARQPFHVVHFDGHGAMLSREASGSLPSSRRGIMITPGEGVLAFEKPGGGADLVAAGKVAALLSAARVPLVVLNACHSGAVGKELEASIATALLKAGCAAVVAMAYSVYAVAAAEFMAAFYEALFAGHSVGEAVTAGRGRLFEYDARPSPKGEMPLADWLVPVHYLRKDVRFPDARAARPAAVPSLDKVLNQIRAAPPETGAVQDPLAAAGGVFVGRDDLFYQLEAAARLQRAVVLTGPGGTGKTELAKGFARWWRDTGGVDDERLVLWHSFETGTGSFSLDVVITSIGLGAFGADFTRLDRSERLAAVKQLLAQHRGLLLWDNFESVAEMPDLGVATPMLDEAGRGQLREFVGWVRDHSKSAVVITSRAREEWLGDVRRVGVGGLNRAEAAEYAGLLLAPFPAGQRRRERRSFGELLDWLDGHPLAMRLTLPRLQDTDPTPLLAALRSTMPLPDAEDARVGRLSSLGACVTYSFAHLNESARRLLPALSLLTGIADTVLLAEFSAADEVPGRFAGTGEPGWAAVLADAARVGLLSPVGVGLYRIHPALPGYLAAAWQDEDPGGYDQEREASEQALRAACATFSRWLTGQIASGNAALAYTRIGLQQRTLGAMLGHALDHRAWDDANGIVRSLDYYWESRGIGGEATAWADLILNATVGPDQYPVATAESLWLYTNGRQAARKIASGHPDQAAQTYQQVLAWQQDQPQTRSVRADIAVTCHQLGMAAHDRGQLDEAEDWYRQSLTIDEELGNHSGMASTYNELGRAAQTRGRLDDAEDWYRQSLAIKEELGDRPGMAISYHQLGITAQARGRLDEADDCYRRSLAIKEELGDRPGMAGSCHQLGRAAQLRGRLDEAEEWYRRSLVISEELGDRPKMAATYHQLGMSAHDRGRLDDAEDWYRRSLAIKEELGDHLGMAISYQELGRAAQTRGRLDDAEDWYRQSLAIKEELGNHPGMAISYHQLGITAQARGRLDDAEDWYRQSLTISEELSDFPTMAATCHQLGMTAQDGGRLDDAEDWYRQSLTISEELSDRPGMALTYAQLGLLAEARAQAPQALAWNIRCVTLFNEFPSPLTGTGPSALARLTRQLGTPALELTWQQAVGQPLPQQVRDYINTHLDDESSQP